MAARDYLCEAALATALLVLSFVSLRALRRSWVETSAFLSQQAAINDFQRKGARLFNSLGGIAADGTGLVLTTPDGARRFVVFVLHRSTLQADLGFWEQVQRLLILPPDEKLVGYCDSSACANALERMGRARPFVVIGYAENRTARVLSSADSDHRALVLDGELRYLGNVKWSDSEPASRASSAIEALL